MGAGSTHATAGGRPPALCGLAAAWRPPQRRHPRRGGALECQGPARQGAAAGCGCSHGIDAPHARTSSGPHGNPTSARPFPPLTYLHGSQGQQAQDEHQRELGGHGEHSEVLWCAGTGCEATIDDNEGQVRTIGVAEHWIRP